MRKGIAILLTVALVALFAVYFFVIRQPNSGLPDFNFPAEDIVQIFFVDKQGNKIQLNKQEDGSWMVNKLYKANESLIQRVLEDISTQEAIGKVPQNIRKMVKKDLQRKYIQVKVYDEDGLVKEYYIGKPDEANRGNYMTMPPLNQIYDVQLPGQQRNMSYDFSTNLNDWRSIWLIDLKPDDIKEVSVTYPDTPANSFKIINNNPQYQVIGDPAINAQVNTNRVTEYLTFFTKLSFVMIANENTDRATELAPQHKFADLEFKLANGRQRIVQFYFHPHTDYSKNPAPASGPAYDDDLLYALTPQDGELYVVTWPLYGRIFRSYSDFYQN